ncbi:regulatory protein RecX [Motiliproteus sp. SC1-56]|uniref:regulatory protein RecX n=1 Tax=Motiliproteus sp. SC1-56 TaxID=2799565 RepID=UPI001F5C8363|nr:regulatory protein RecX [Motiliproteus sp. SC1-56]
MEVEQELYEVAIGLLARREHSRRELSDKLRGRAGDGGALDRVLDRLAEEGLQSDVRFAASFVRARVERGQGSLRIRQELGQKGVDSETQALALEDCEVDWFERALAVKVKRFGGAPPEDRREYARQARFLSYRGFTGEQVQYALENRDALDF